MPPFGCGTSGERTAFGISQAARSGYVPRTFMVKRQSANTFTPAQLGFSMPAEWEPHEATWLGWPHNATDWPGKFAAIPWVYGEMVRKISAGEIIRLLVRHQAEEKLARRVLQRTGCNLKKIQFVVHPTNRGWTRDSGPIFLKRSPKSKAQSPKSETAIVHFHFNGWAKYRNWRKDTKVPETAARVLRKKLFHAECRGRPFVIEGGGIELNGRGTLLSTEQCYLDPRVQVRNPGLGKTEIETTLKNYLGVKNIFWLAKGPVGDDTHGHIDDICRFVNPKTLVLVREKNSRDVNYRPLAENWERIRDLRLEDRRAAGCGGAAHARAVVFRRRPFARQLRKFLHQQRRRHRPDVQRPKRPRRARDFGRIVQGPAGGGHPCR